MDAADVAAEKEAAFIAERLRAQAAFIAERLRAQAAAAALGRPGTGICTDCNEAIPAARRRALPSAIRCVECEAWVERVRKIPA